jgi:hypothetical protein
VLLGVAQLTKFTCLLLYAVWPLLGLIFLLSERTARHPPPRLVILRGAQGLFIVLLSLLFLNLGYEFQGSFRRLGDIPFISETLSGDELKGGGSGNRFRGNWLGTLRVPVPEEYLRGIDVQRQEFEKVGKKARSYLAGRWSEVGWWYYYLYALAIKVPLGAWALVLWGLTLTVCRHASCARGRDELALWLPALAVLMLVSSQTGFNHHMRYVLPMFPFVIISTSKLAYFLRPESWKAGLVILALLAWFAFSSLSIRPHYMSYFNELAGGPGKGHDHLVDSNIDWGQDLLFLKKWLDGHPEARPLSLAYYNPVDARLIGIDYSLPPFGPTGGLPPDEIAARSLGPSPGYYAISVNYLRGSASVSPFDGKGKRTGLRPHVYAYFREFQPIARAGYSIYVYHVTAEEANRVRRKYGLPPLPAPNSPPSDGARSHCDSPGR